jgi:hypothetical protein
MSGSDLNKPSKTNWAKLNNMTDKDIDTSDVPELGDDFFNEARLRLPKSVSVTLDIDPDTLAWFTAHENSQELMKAALRLYAEVHRQAS